MKAQRFDPHAPVVYSVLRHSAAQAEPFLVTFVRDPDQTACEALRAAGRVAAKSVPVIVPGSGPGPASDAPAPQKEDATPVR